MGRPCSSTIAPRRVSSFNVRVMILCSTVCSASSLGAATSTKTGRVLGACAYDETRCGNLPRVRAALRRAPAELLFRDDMLDNVDATHAGLADVALQGRCRLEAALPPGTRT